MAQITADDLTVLIRAVAAADTGQALWQGEHGYDYGECFNNLQMVGFGAIAPAPGGGTILVPTPDGRAFLQSLRTR